MKRVILAAALGVGVLALALGQAGAPATRGDKATVDAEHAGIGVTEGGADAAFKHTEHPDAQWFEDARLGLFIHWSICSVKGINISWSMFEGLNGKSATITPNDYWAEAKDFHPQKYDPDKWLKAAKEAGFTYAVFTTRHHDGYAMWPSKFGDFGTRTYMDGRDLVKPFVEACRKNGLKVGLYYSPPDWYFERETKNFRFGRNTGSPLGPDLKGPPPKKLTAEETAAREKEYAARIKGQVEELLTNYGKIDLLWFDGRPPIADPASCISLERIRELQPGIVVDPRLHRVGDYKTYERTLKTDKVATTWAEYCDTWTDYWPHVNGAPFRAPGFVVGRYVTSRNFRVNYLLGVGPNSDGELVPEIYQQFGMLKAWHEKNGESVLSAKPLPAGEKASVPATADRSVRYLFLVPEFKGPDGRFADDQLPAKDVEVTYTGGDKPDHVTLLADGKPLEFSYAEKTVTVKVPAMRRTKNVDVVKLEWATR